MRKYQKYKPSDVEWIGDIPEEWELKKMKHLTEYKNGASFKSEDFSKDEIIPVIRIGEVGDIIDFDDCVKLPASYLERYSDFIVKNGDILVGLTGGTIGKSGRYNYEIPSLLNQRVCIIRNKENLHNKLLYYFVKSEVFIRNILYNCYGGGQDNIGKEDIINMLFPFPTTLEQNKIVQYLDEKTEIIDKLISTKERKIELLKQQRTSLINQVITKGLEPNVKMKDSGVEWIGEIPEHWNLVYLRHYTDKVGSGVTPKGGSETYIDEGVIFIRSQNVHFDGLRLEEVVRISEEVHNSMSGSKVQKNDVLLNITGGSIGRCCVVDRDDDMNVNQHVSIIRPKENLLPYFLNYYLSSAIGQNSVEYFISGGNREGLTFESIKCFQVPLPNNAEQQQIISHLNNRTKEIDDLVSMEQKKIDLLKEYRQSLISEVITGKIDVRSN